MRILHQDSEPKVLIVQPNNQTKILKRPTPSKVNKLLKSIAKEKKKSQEKVEAEPVKEIKKEAKKSPVKVSKP